MDDEQFEVLYARSTYGEEEHKAVNEVLNNPKQLVGGPKTDELEQRVAKYFSKDHAVMVNSGSSANYLAVEALELPPGSEVVTPATTFSTTVAPLVKNDLMPVFVDIDPRTYQAKPEQIRSAISEDTSAILVPSLVGNLPKLDEIRGIAEQEDVYFIEDSADTIGAEYDGSPSGLYSDVSTTSFYASHIVTGFGGGGMLCTDSVSVRDRAKKLRGWGRDSAVEETEDIDQRLSKELDGIHYDQKFTYGEVGYNFLPLEASAAFCLEQLDKLESFAAKRQRHFQIYREFFSQYTNFFLLPEEYEETQTNWLAFPIQIREDAPFKRAELVKYLEANNIQTRSLWSGNITRHPGFAGTDYRIEPQTLQHADTVMESAFVIGIHQALTEEKTNYVKRTIETFLAKQS